MSEKGGYCETEAGRDSNPGCIACYHRHSELKCGGRASSFLEGKHVHDNPYFLRCPYRFCDRISFTSFRP